MQSFRLTASMTCLLTVATWLISGTAACAQDNAGDQPLFLRYPTIPHFTVITADGKSFTEKDLKKNTPTLIFLFSVDCEHCHHETEDIVQHIHQFKGTQILMVTHFPVNDMTQYAHDYHLDQYPRIITVATDEKRWLLSFYRLHFFPGLYIYNANNQLVYHAEGTRPVDTLLHYLKP
ncbi:MAG: redoxin domain-containing protein [Thermoflavifilum sp.]|uniref:TlpA family protein disulfide reductase n=1 Tax=Thermoflavifilum sp. TaxID=1968839 RepID=UPI0018A4A2A5|nr:redoxin domain-containing protein [Thermoflavifilum sp.]QOR75869.1 MAG: redoxin domain-containing protein [Thermoflavifilum sp.]